MKSAEVRQKFIEFYKAHGHVVIPSAPLVPENDPTTLFTSSGMQPMIPYLLGEPSPSGNRLVDSQKCFRAQDIEEVGDNRHDTFFEMLGNWSLGDYFKGEQLAWFYEFLTRDLSLPSENLYVSVFEGHDQIPKDEETANIWLKLGVPKDHIFYYGVNKNWWSRSGPPDQMPIGEPGGPDSEVFYDFGTPHDQKYGIECHPNCDCGRFMEIGNSVFMTYKKTDTGFTPLEKKNIDFGGGLERLTAAVNHDPDQFKTDLYSQIISEIETLSGKSYADHQVPMRIIADHLKAATFLIGDGVIPSNKAQGYFLRRLVRRAVFKMMRLEIPIDKAIPSICTKVIATYKPLYFSDQSWYQIHPEIGGEAEKFLSTLHRGTQFFESQEKINAQIAFDLFQSYGFPFELTQELAKEKGVDLKKDEFENLMKKHQDLSRTASKGMFKGGLANQSDRVVKLHTATHLLHAALRKFLGSHVEQKGSNITGERLRFDFTHPTGLTDGQKTEIESWVNEQIKKDLPVSTKTTTLAQAKAGGALAFFGERYGDHVNVYSIGDEKTGIVSQEVCGGPHVTHAGEVGTFQLGKEKSVSAGIRRVYATVS